MQHLGEYVVAQESFPTLHHLLQQLKSPPFQSLPEPEKMSRLNAMLLRCIQEADPGQFILIQVTDFIEQIQREKILDHFHFNHFELWLNQHSGLSPEENYIIRGKIAGRLVPRDEYQRLFPLGGGKSYAGTHFVTAHSSPDLDTTVSSFWGWVDAFSARVSEGLHVWNIPGGAPPAQVELSFLFDQIFGPRLFSNVAKHRTSLSLSSLDLVTQQGLSTKELQHSVFDIDYEQSPQDVVVVDADGYYVGEWRSTDFDRVRSLINLLNQCLRWYENSLHVKLISLFAMETVTQLKVAQFVTTMLHLRIEECEPAKEFTTLQRSLVEKYLRTVLGVEHGCKTTLADFAKAMARQNMTQFQEFVDLIGGITLFDPTGKIIESRSAIFGYLARVIAALESGIYSVRLFVDQLAIALQVKSKVLGLFPNHVSYRADLEEIRTQMGTSPFITVTASDPEGRIFPLGIIHATDLFKPLLGTVTLRDFSNREETKIPPYLDVISMIDHHKSQLSTTAPTVVWITDAQSSNSTVAQISFEINDRYTTGGMSLATIEQQIRETQRDLSTASS